MSGRLGSTRFVHPALFYRSDAGYLDKIVPFVTEGPDKGHAVGAGYDLLAVFTEVEHVVREVRDSGPFVDWPAAEPRRTERVWVVAGQRSGEPRARAHW